MKRHSKNNNLFMIDQFIIKSKGPHSPLEPTKKDPETKKNIFV